MAVPLRDSIDLSIPLYPDDHALRGNKSVAKIIPISKMLFLLHNPIFSACYYQTGIGGFIKFPLDSPFPARGRDRSGFFLFS